MIIDLLRKRPVLNMITTTLPLTYGGRTKSLLRRALLLNQAGVAVRLVTTNYREQYEEVYQDYYAKKKVASLTTFENIYDFYRKQLEKPWTTQKWEALFERVVGSQADYTTIYRSDNHNWRYLYQDGLPKVLMRFSKGGLRYFATYQPTNRDPRVFYHVHKKGYVHRIDIKDHHQRLIEQQFLTKQGKPYITRYLSARGRVTGVALHLAQKTVHFETETDFFAHFYREIFSEKDVVVSDARALDGALLQTPVASRLFQLHNPHLANPLKSKTVIKGAFRNALEGDLSLNDRIITLTAQQKTDIVELYPNLANQIVVIPHSTPERQLRYEKTSGHFSVIARLHPQKNIGDIIRAFYRFHQKYPNYILDIYGEGESLPRLEALVKRTKLEDHVVFHGRVEQVDKVYQQSEALIVASVFEGFALNVLEALANGTQVVTYPVNYGPTDIIDDKSGFVTSERTPASLAEQMVAAVEQPKRTADIVARSRVFSDATFVKRWLEVTAYDSNVKRIK